MKKFIAVLCLVGFVSGVAYAESPPERRPERPKTDLFSKMDKDGDGVLTRDEFESLKRPEPRPPFVFSPRPTAEVRGEIKAPPSRPNPARFGPQPVGRPPEFGPRRSSFQHGAGTYWGGVAGPYWMWHAPR